MHDLVLKLAKKYTFYATASHLVTTSSKKNTPAPIVSNSLRDEIMERERADACYAAAR